MNEAKKAVPVHILTGFLGSGKTTLLSRVLEDYKSRGLKPAVLMNELGEVNLDGMLVDEEVPMTEMLGGCICCTIRGDLGMELRALVQEHQPDVVFVECTGAANPIEVIDGVTDASLLLAVDLRSVVTVVDAADFLERSDAPGARTFKLMSDQIRCATQLVLNKMDLVKPEELLRIESMLRELNPAARILPTVRCEVAAAVFEQAEGAPVVPHGGAAGGGAAACSCGAADSQEHVHTHKHEEHCSSRTDSHHTHEHVMVYTHYFRQPVDSEAFEALVGRLPREIYRAKGILRFSDTASPFLFQYAYREMDFVKLAPKEELPSVAVFIGEHFDKRQLVEELSALEEAQPATS